MVLQWGGYAPALYWEQNFCERGVFSMQNRFPGIKKPARAAAQSRPPRASRRAQPVDGRAPLLLLLCAALAAVSLFAFLSQRNPGRGAGDGGAQGQPAPPADEGAAADAASGEADGLLLLVNPWTPLPEDFLPGQPAPPADEGAAADAASGEADGLLLLVNPWTPLPEDFLPGELVPVQNDQAVDARAYPDLQDMLQDMSQAGLSPLICSSYRSQERQQELYDNKVQRVMAEGVSLEAAQAEAARWVARPGTSEHQTGLAVDIVSLSNQMLDETQESTPEFQWLAENAWKYGFILRYPNDKSEKTGIAYEPWHFRFVGKEAAEEMHDLGLCLEEYLESLAD